MPKEKRAGPDEQVTVLLLANVLAMLLDKRRAAPTSSAPHLALPWASRLVPASLSLLSLCKDADECVSPYVGNEKLPGASAEGAGQSIYDLIAGAALLRVGHAPIAVVIAAGTLEATGLAEMAAEHGPAVALRL